MTFTDDLRGLTRAEQIARVQAAARAAGDELDESQADQVLSLYADLAGDEMTLGTTPCFDVTFSPGKSITLLHALLTGAPGIRWRAGR